MAKQVLEFALQKLAFGIIKRQQCAVDLPPLNESKIKNRKRPGSVVFGSQTSEYVQTGICYSISNAGPSRSGHANSHGLVVQKRL
jgi:hypothetical protein